MTEFTRRATANELMEIIGDQTAQLYLFRTENRVLTEQCVTQGTLINELKGQLEAALKATADPVAQPEPEKVV